MTDTISFLLVGLDFLVLHDSVDSIGQNLLHDHTFLCMKLRSEDISEMALC